ncbi:MAG: hypothetical protein ACLR1T_14585 [Evtepia gabavorous]
MQVEFGRLVTALGQAVSEAQRAVAAHAIGNYLAYFRRGPADQDGGAGYAPNTTRSCSPIHRRREGASGCGALW